MPTSSPIPLFCLHFLGGSARSWDDVASAMSLGVTCVAFDLPGFGSAADRPGAAVAAMADEVLSHIGEYAPRRWWIAGHSMGAKVALAVAAKAAREGLAGLAGIALLAGSPPAPEPMEESKRRHMLSWIDAGAEARRAAAHEYIRENVGDPLDPSAEDHAVRDVLRANPEAWKAWLTGGSREDWQQAIGVLATKALVLSGTEDAALGPEVHRKLMLPHLSHHRHIELEGAGHLLPLERPGTVAAHLRDAMTVADYI